LTIRSDNYFYHFNIVGVKTNFNKKLNLYKKVSTYLEPVGIQPNDIKKLTEALKHGIIRSKYKGTILSKEDLDRVILRGKKKELENLDFEKYKEKIEKGARNYIYQERDVVSGIIVKLENIRKENFKDYKNKISEFANPNLKKDITLNINFEDLKEMDFKQGEPWLSGYYFQQELAKFEKELFKYEHMDFLNKKIILEMTQIITSLEKKILIPRIRLDTLNNIIEELKDSKLIFEYENLGGKDKSINIFIDHFIKFFILANIILLLITPKVYKKIHKLLNVKN